MATQLPSRRNNRGLNRRNANSAPSRRNVPNVGASQDPGVRVPKGLFGEFETERLAQTGEGLQNLSNQLFAQHKREQLQLERISILENQEYASSQYNNILKGIIPDINNQSGSKK
jgi:hypothetical protein